MHYDGINKKIPTIYYLYGRYNIYIKCINLVIKIMQVMTPLRIEVHNQIILEISLKHLYILLNNFIGSLQYFTWKFTLRKLCLPFETLIYL